jgi:hypothetical protein
MSNMAFALSSLGGAAAAASAAGLTSTARQARASMMGIDPETGTTILDEQAFQFWPETLQDSIEIGWEPKQVPAMSHALMQWGSNGGRTFSFELEMIRVMKPLGKQPSPLGLPPENPMNEANQPFNVNIEYMVSWFRAFCYPDYQENAVGIRRAKSPPIAILNMPNMCLNEDGSDIIFAVMTGCDITYEKLFSDGQPRMVKVSLTFKQVIENPQQGGKLYNFKGYKEFKQARIKFADETLYGKSNPIDQIRNPLP